MTISACSQFDYLKGNTAKLAKSCAPLWHPLGFASCVIREEPGVCVTRVHYWPKGERRCKNPDWPIHTHVYDLSSFVLMGRVRDIQYQEGIDADYTVYSVSYLGSDSKIDLTHRRVSIESVVDRYHQAGEEYSVRAGSFHQTHVEREESALTLVTLSNFQDTKPLVLGEAAEQSYPYDRTQFDQGHFWSVVKQAVDDLTRPSESLQ